MEPASSRQPRGARARWWGRSAGAMVPRGAAAVQSQIQRHEDRPHGMDCSSAPTLATLRGDAGYGVIEDGALGWHDGRIVYVGPRAGCRGARSAGREVIDATAGSRRAWSTAIPTWCSPATARANSSCACRARATSRSPVPAAASLSTVRATRAADEDELLRAVAAARARPGRRRRHHAGDQVRLRPGLRQRTQDAARRAPASGESSGSTVRTTFLGAHALPPEFAGRADDYIDARRATCCRGCGRRPGRCGRCVLRRHRLLAGADAPRVRGGARAGPAGEAARRPAQRPGRRGARGGIRRAVRRPHRIHQRSRRARDGGARHRRRAVARRLPRPARNQAAAARRCCAQHGVPMAVATDCNPGHVAAAVAAAGDATGLHAFPAHAGGSPARRHVACRARAGPG